MNIFDIILYTPLFNALIFLYGTVAFENLGVAIIFLTILVRLILYPLFHKTAKHQRVAQNLQPEIKKIRSKHKDDREAQTKELMGLYQKNKINPFTPFLLLIIQLPILFALYRIFTNGFSPEALEILYPFISNPGELNQVFLGTILLSVASVPMAIITAIAQFFQGKLALTRAFKTASGELDAMQRATKMIVFVGPVIALVVLVKFPAALALYWLTSTLFSIMQQVIVNKSVDKEHEGNKKQNK